MEPIGFRPKKVSKLMQSKGIDVLIASSPENVFYTSGMPVRHAEKNPILYVLANQYPTIVVIGKEGEEALLTWQVFMSTEKASWIQNVSGALTINDALNNLTSSVRDLGLSANGTIGIESHMPYYQYERLAKEFPNAKVRVSDDVFIEMRVEKSEEEVRRIRESTRITEKAIEAMVGKLKEGVSDNELIKTAKAKIIDEGADGIDHVTLGIGGSDPEYPGTGVRMTRRDLARFDVGAIYQGYGSDVSRHAFIGKPERDLEDSFKLMVELQQTAIDATKPGVKPIQAFKAAEAAHKKSGKSVPFFMTIHSVGIQIEEFHFYDALKGASELAFGKNNVVDIEIWTLSSEQGLVGNEDTFLVTTSGCERLSRLERRIFDVG